MPDWDIMLEQMLVYFVFTYFCGAVYDGRIQAKMQVCVYSVYIIEESCAPDGWKMKRHFHGRSCGADLPLFQRGRTF